MTADLRDQLQAAVGSTYTIERELGGGGMARVFVAAETALGRQVVLKVLRPEIAEAVSIERFRRETQLAARLQHPHIVPLFGGGEAGGFLYYTMPLVEGESLRERLQAVGQLPVAEALRLARESADALAYAHAHGVVHRDIKPENILLSDGHALVSDFGIARAVDRTDGERLTSIGLVVGTPAYMSPEQASGETEVDGRSDIYSLGCVLYEMLTGEAPFAGPSVQAIIARRFTKRAPSVRAVRAQVAPEVEAVTATAMATLPAERFATATELARALDAAAVRSANEDHTTGPASRRDDTIATGQSTHGKLPRALRLLTAAAVAVAAAGAATWGIARLRGAESGAAPPAGAAGQMPSIAVLYLENHLPDTLDAYLADGLTEEITSRLGRISRLRVKSRGAAGRVRSANIQDPSAAGQMLDVQYVVRGDVRRAGDRVRASVQLVRTADGSELWSDDYDATAGNLLALQDSIAQQVATRVSGQLSASERAALATPSNVNPEAHDHYLRGTFQLAKRTPLSVARAIEEFQTAGRIDPTMTSALAREGYAYAVFADWGWPHSSGLTAEQMVQRGLAAADRALRQDSTSAEAWLARALLLALRNPRTLDGVVPAFERAVSLDSTNAETQYQYGQALMSSGFAAQAIARYRRAIALESDWASPLMSLGALVSRSHDWDEGLRWLDSALAVDPSSSYTYSARSTTRTAAGKAALALVDARAAVRVAAGHRVPPNAAMAIALAANGDMLAARQWADSTLLSVPDTTRPSATDAFYAAAALVHTGQPERGLALLGRVSPPTAWLWFYMTSPLFDAVRAHQQLVRVSERAKPPGA